MVRRIYVEKKKGFDVEAEALFNDVKENLHLDSLTGIRILNRYDIDGIDDETYESSKLTIFAEPAIDVVYEETMPEDLSSAIFFAVEYLPGQYDQRADSAASSDVQKDQGYQEVHLHLTRDHLSKHRLQYFRAQ